MPRLVIDLADGRPVFALPERVIAGIRARLPAGWDAVVVDSPAVGTGDGGSSPSPATLEAVRDAQIYLGFGVPPEVLRAGEGLRWVHTGTTGVAASLTPEMLTHNVLFTNSAGIHGPPVAETVIGFILHFARGLDFAVRAQAAGTWDKSAFDGPDPPVRELGRSTVGVVGVGGIGREVARRAGALGARIIGVRRRPDQEPVSGVELLTGDDALNRLLGASHYVVMCVPETSETHRLIGTAQLARMRHDAVLINIARGGLIDQDALVAALEAKQIRGAALDVFAPEPLPDGHPLWSLPNVLVTPHVSAYSHGFWDREAALIEDNLERYFAGRTLRNVVDKRAGY